MQKALVKSRNFGLHQLWWLGYLCVASSRANKNEKFLHKCKSYYSRL